MITEIYVKMKQAFVPILVGWALTIWLPVPGVIGGALSTTVNAAVNGVSAIIATISGPSDPQAGRARSRSKRPEARPTLSRL